MTYESDVFTNIKWRHYTKVKKAMQVRTCRILHYIASVIKQKY